MDEKATTVNLVIPYTFFTYLKAGGLTVHVLGRDGELSLAVRGVESLQA